jgi:hypothetical protein
LAAVVACVLWLCCGAYAGGFVYRGWIPHDEGTIGQSADRVLHGEMPHRDFDDPYTGGLAYLHAAGMRVLGVNLGTPRLMLFGFFMAFLAAVYGIARRVASPAAGWVAMLLATVWSVPNYFVSLPSWYNLFFATFGTLALLLYLDTERRRWLFIAGACAGVSLLMKVSGLFYLGAGLVFLAYVEQTRMPIHDAGLVRRSAFWPIATIPVALVALLGVALWESGASGLLPLLAPALAIGLFVVWREWSQGTGRLAQRAGRLATLVWPFVAGAAVPVALFVLVFWQQDGLTDLLRGVFVLPQRRMVEASATPPPVGAIGLVVPYVVLLLAGGRVALGAVEPGRPKWSADWLVAGVVAVLGGVALAMASHARVYQGIWDVARAMPLGVAMTAIWAIAGRVPPGPVDDRERLTRARVFLLATMTAFVSLVQIPYATPIYFCYVAPMIVLAVLAIVYAQPRAFRRGHVAVAAFFFLFAIVFVNRSYGWNLGVTHLPYNPSAQLDVPRGGLLVPDDDKRTYEEIVRLVQQHASGGTIYAGPDCPEVYFLSGFANPSRSLFDFLSPIREDERWMTDLLARSPIRAAVVNTAPLFSRPIDPAALAVLEQRFPTAVRVGKFVVRFK